MGSFILPELRDIAIKLYEIGEEMYSTSVLQGSLTNALEEWEGKIATRKIELTPLNGWEGKNETERTASRDIVFLNDPMLKEYTEMRDLKRRDIVQVGAMLTALHERRRGLEWAARIMLIPIEREDRESYPTPPF